MDAFILAPSKIRPSSCLKKTGSDFNIEAKRDALGIIIALVVMGTAREHPTDLYLCLLHYHFPKENEINARIHGGIMERSLHYVK